MSSSDKPDRVAPKGAHNPRSKQSINRVQMYRERARRTKKGKYIEGSLKFHSKKSAAGIKARLPPDKTLFGGSRFAPQKVLQQVRDDYETAQNNPLSVVLTTAKFPMSLIKPEKQKRMDLLSADSFANTFGPKSQRKRPNISFDIPTDAPPTENPAELPFMANIAGSTMERDEPEDGLSLLVKSATARGANYDEEKDSNILKEEEFKDATRHSMFDKGQSKRIWSELYKVIDASDVIAVVLDARDAFGTRAYAIEKYIKENAQHKHIIFVMNKCDLVPAWVVRHNKYLLSQEYPTIAFHANINKPFGKDALFKLLSEMHRLHREKKTISVGLVGYPNVGKSSVINTLMKKKACNVAPVPGQTKVWQYVKLTNGIFLIDCPGIVPPSHKDTDTQLILKGVVRVENVQDASIHIPYVLSIVKHEYIEALYGVESWTNATDFLDQLAKKKGKLLQGGESKIDDVAKIVLSDFQRGRIPFFILNNQEGEVINEEGVGDKDDKELNDEELNFVDAKEEEEEFPIEEEEEDDEDVLDMLKQKRKVKKVRKKEKERHSGEKRRKERRMAEADEDSQEEKIEKPKKKRSKKEEPVIKDNEDKPIMKQKRTHSEFM
ncbi:putative Nucleolar GTP-binding protein 2 [Blattamonas nauphoetae]|uniref:Nucleolar GTP-binding protein 2 n=1 Tax=Blattamonas nauphoetae TaxID=2049346 RepID=A0ABQ9YKH2_9EUKA|nr:putative Nucleolar GTP-binding protein 2 [Blattamonas nauphoetae]